MTLKTWFFRERMGWQADAGIHRLFEQDISLAVQSEKFLTVSFPNVESLSISFTSAIGNEIPGPGYGYLFLTESGLTK